MNKIAHVLIAEGDGWTYWHHAIAPTGSLVDYDPLLELEAI